MKLTFLEDTTQIFHEKKPMELVGEEELVFNNHTHTLVQKRQTNHGNCTSASWWLNQPIPKILVKLDHFPKVRGDFFFWKGTTSAKPPAFELFHVRFPGVYILGLNSTKRQEQISQIASFGFSYCRKEYNMTTI